MSREWGEWRSRREKGWAAGRDRSGRDQTRVNERVERRRGASKGIRLDGGWEGGGGQWRWALRRRMKGRAGAGGIGRRRGVSRGSRLTRHRTAGTFIKGRRKGAKND